MSKHYNIIKHIPNICTLFNAICGVLALMIAVFHRNHDAIHFACLLIAIGVVLDSLDGYLARKLNICSPIGKELDSFADVVTFGIAPVCVFLSLYTMHMDRLLSLFEMAVCAVYIACAIYRLARYNVSSAKTYFIGLPTTAAGIVMSVYIFVSNCCVECWLGCSWYSVMSFGLFILLGIAMVSSIRVNRIK